MKTSLGKKIKTLRLERGLSQSELGERAGTTQQVIQQLESGASKTSRKIVEIAGALGCTAEFLMNIEKKPDPKNTESGGC